MEIFFNITGTEFNLPHARALETCLCYIDPMNCSAEVSDITNSIMKSTQCYIEMFFLC